MLVVATIAALVRLPAVFNGLPYVSHPDEPKNYLVFHDMVSGRSVLPRFYNYPSLFFEVEAVAHTGAMGALKLVGSDQTLGLALGGAIGGRLVQSSFAWVVARLVVLSISVLGVVVAARLAERLTGSRLAGAAAGVLAALSTISMASGSVITPDALAGTLSLCAVSRAVGVFTLDLGEARTVRRWALQTGVLLGLAVSAKYNTVVLAFPIALAATLAFRGDRRFGWKPFAIVGAAAAAVFVATTPGIILDNARFMYDVRHELDHYRTGHSGAEGNSFITNLRFLWSSDGLAVVVALIGLGLRRSRALLVLWAWPVAYLITIGFAKVRFARNLTPIVGVVAVLAGCGLYEITRRVRRRHVTLVVAACLVPLAVVQLWAIGQRLRKDFTDYQGDARAWLMAHVPEGTDVLAEYYTPFLDPQRWTVEPVDSSLDEKNAAETYDVVILTSGGAGRYLKDPGRYPDQVERVTELRDQACRAEHYEDDFGFWVDVLVMNCATDEG